MVRWRLATGSAYGTISASALAMSRLSAYLVARCPTAGPVVIDRRLIEGYILAPSSDTSTETQPRSNDSGSEAPGSVITT